MRLEILMENRGMTLIAPLMFFVSLRGLFEAIKRLERIGILCLLVATLAVLARNDNWNLVMLSEAKHLFQIPCCFGFPLVIIFIYDSMLGFFFKGDRGATCHSKHEVLAFL